LNRIAPSLHNDDYLRHWFGSIGFEAIKLEKDLRKLLRRTEVSRGCGGRCIIG
jgi:hypothetical protein